MFIYIIGFILGVILYRHWLKPYILYRRYVKYGKGEFYPFLGVFYGAGQRVKKYGDVDYHLKHMFENGGENAKLFVENNSTNVILKLADVEYIKEFTQLEGKVYNKSMMFLDDLIRLVGKGVIFSEGPQWKKNRNVLSGVFHFESLAKRVPSIEKITKEVYQRYIDEKNFKNIDMIEVFQEITAEVVVQTFFSNVSKDKTFYGMSLSVALSYLVNSIGLQLLSPGYFLFGKQYFEWGLTERDRVLNKQIKEFRELVGTIIQGRIDEEEEFEKRGEVSTKEDLCYYLKKNNLLGEMSLDQIINEFMTFYVAGMDTTGHLCGMAVWYLTQAPDIKAKLQAELDANTDHSPKGLLNLPYLNGVIQETQRLYGPAGQLFNRVALQDHYLKDIFVAKGTLVKPVPVAVHRNPKYWEDPHAFKPERWFNKSAITPFAFIPFNAGPRNCIGQHLALIEARILLSVFMRTFQFELDPSYEMILNYSFLIEPLHKLRINLTVKDASVLAQ